jgi:hypothetical protein
MATGTNSYSIGTASTDNYLISFGDNMTFSYASNSVAIGYSVKSYGNSVTIGYGAQTKTSGLAIGMNSIIGANGQYGVAIGNTAQVSQTAGIAIGSNTQATQMHTIALGRGAKATAQYAIQLGGWGATNSDAGTVKIANANGNFEIMSADGTIPTARLTKVNTTVTLAAAGWSNGSQTVTVTGMTATGVVLVSPDPTDQSAYTSAGIICTAQAADSLTFTCSTTPTADLSVNVVML